jgi:hypothetical protein
MKRFLVPLGALLIAGCAADRNARELGRVTLSQVVAYEDSVRQLSRQLNSHYKTTADNLAVNLAREAGNDLERARMTDAEDAAVAALDKGRLDPPMIRDFLTVSVQSEKEREIAVAAQIGAVRTGQKRAMADLQVKEDRLKEVRGKLERLQVDPGFTSYLNRLKPLFDAVKASGDAPQEGSAP